MQQTIDEEVPLYEPIQFVYDGIIGAKNSQQEDNTNYQWQHKEIVKPQPSCAVIEYILYHTPGIFNWLKTVQAAQRTHLNNYILGKATGMKTLHSKPILQLMNEYAEKWEVVRLAFQCQFYVEKADCQHISKRTLWSIDYQYKFKTNSLNLESIYCKNCEKLISVHSSKVKKYPEVVALRRKEEKLVLEGSAYELHMVLVKQSQCELFIKIAGGQWYEIKNKSIRVVGSQTLPKQAEKWLYLKSRPQINNLKAAEPAVVSVPKPTKRVSEVIQSIPIKQHTQIDDADKKPGAINPQKQRVVITQQAKLRPLKEESYVPETYQPATDYTSKIKGQYPKQKIKDQYDIEYDKGKVKKVKTKKIKKRIDFNEVFKKVKAGLVQEITPNKKVYKDRNDSTDGFFRK